ncbi:MAG: S41 family peptidase [Fimbriimonadaceae bacterium]
MAAVITCACAVILGVTARQYTDTGGAASSRFASLNAPGQTVVSTDNVQTISEADFFYDLTVLLEQDYVEPIDDERALAIGAVRGMIDSLDDPSSVFMEPDVFQVFRNSQRGVFQGVGVELRFEYDQEFLSEIRNGTAQASEAMRALPKVFVATIVPGGSAEAAGVRPGDRLIQIDEDWVLSPVWLEELREMQEALRDGEASAEEVFQMTISISERIEESITPMTAKERLTLGDSGRVRLVVERNGEEREFQLEKGTTEVPSVSKRGDAIQVRFYEESTDEIIDLLRQDEPLTLDLRNSTSGSQEALREVLLKAGPARTWGFLVSEQYSQPRTLAIQGEGKEFPPMTLIIDESTVGAAAIFAAAMQAGGYAELEGTLVQVQFPWREVRQLPDGSGYTLAIADFVTKLDEDTEDAA